MLYMHYHKHVKICILHSTDAGLLIKYTVTVITSILLWFILQNWINWNVILFTLLKTYWNWDKTNMLVLYIEYILFYASVFTCCNLCLFFLAAFPFQICSVISPNAQYRTENIQLPHYIVWLTLLLPTTLEKYKQLWNIESNHSTITIKSPANMFAAVFQIWIHTWSTSYINTIK